MVRGTILEASRISSAVKELVYPQSHRSPHTHVSSSIRTNKGEDGRDLANGHGSGNTTPSTTVLESSKDGVGIILRTQNPKRDENGKEAENVKEENQALQQRQVLGAVGVEECGDQSDCNGEKSSLPASRDVIRMIQHNQTLNHSSSQEGSRCSTSLPTKSRDPADNVAEKPLEFLGRKFGDPMVLATGSWSHGSHVCH